jgi:hypothetical protein
MSKASGPGRTGAVKSGGVPVQEDQSGRRLDPAGLRGPVAVQLEHAG